MTIGSPMQLLFFAALDVAHDDLLELGTLVRPPKQDRFPVC